MGRTKRFTLSAIVILVMGSLDTANVSAANASFDLISRADPNQASATAGANMSQQLNQRAFSADGRFVVFLSQSENLIPNLVQDQVTTNVYLYDRVTKTTTLVSHAAGSSNTSANAESFVPCISGDGRYVVYWTFATNVVANQVDDEPHRSTPDVFVYDRTTGENKLVSHVPGAPTTAADSNSYDPTISFDGRFISFTSAASNLIAGQAKGGFSAIFSWDRDSDSITLVSHRAGDSLTTSGGSTFNSVLSSDGAFVAFMSNSPDIVAGQTQSAARYQVFLWNRSTNTSVLVSHSSSSATTAGNNGSFYPVLNADASYVAFYGLATDLVPNGNDVNQDQDVFVYERATGNVTLVSHNAGSPTNAGTGASLYPEISADGRYVVYQSSAVDLVGNDLNNAQDIFVWDRSANSNALVSRSATSPVSASANGRSFGGQIAGDGNTISFTSEATDLISTQSSSGKGDVFLFDRTTSAIQLVSRKPGSPSAGGDQQSVLPLPSDDGMFVAFSTQATDLVANDQDGSADVMIYDRAAGSNECASLRPANLASMSANGNSGSQHASADGRFVVFVSEATNLVANQSDANGKNDIFVRDRQTGLTVLVTRAAGTTNQTGDDVSDSPQISGDGRWITYASLATNLVPGMVDAGGVANVYLFDRQNGATALVSHSLAGANFSGSDFSNFPVISDDGRYVAYTSFAVDLVTGQVDSNADSDVFIYDRTTGINALVSHNSSALTVTGLQYSFAPSISRDGRFVAYYSAATDLVPGQNNTGDSVQHCFLYDRVTNANAMLDHQFGAVSTSGDGNAGSTEPLDPPVFSADGGWIVYASGSTNLVSGQTDTNADYDLFLFDRAAGTNLLVSHQENSLTTTGDDISYNPSISADGRFISYRSAATNLVAGQNDTNTFQDVFLFDRDTRTNTLVSHAFGQRAAAGNALAGEAPRYGYQSVSPDGRFVAFWSSSTDLVPGYSDRNGLNGDLYLFDRFSGGNRLITLAPGTVATGGNGGSGDSVHIGGPIWSANGGTIFLASRAANLIAEDFNNREDVFAYKLPVLPVSIVSRKTHGTAGTFDVNLSLGETECRTSASPGTHQIVLHFERPVSLGSAVVSSGSGSVANTVITESDVTVNLSGVADAQTTGIVLSDLSDGTNLSDLVVPISFVIGDASGNGAVTNTDVAAAKSQVSATITQSNFRLDITANGAISNTDVSAVKSRVGMSLQ
ncbi:MAG TPA: hypothetical protein VJ719_06415 [Chthoniobacterales bacterium]|nr:hypothetical protein [Chthoniobacterales bacterium]